MRHKTILILASVLGAISVAIGAFGAHGLRETLEASAHTRAFETAVEYQFYHALALLVIGALMRRYHGRMIRWSAYAMLTGIFLFSGSLYIICLADVPTLGMITPLGGLFLITGWSLLAIGIYNDGGDEGRTEVKRGNISKGLTKSSDSLRS